MTIKHNFTDSAEMPVNDTSILLRHLPQGVEIAAPHNAYDHGTSHDWSLTLEADGTQLLTCDFSCDPGEGRIKVDSIIIHEDLGQNGLGRQIIRNIAGFARQAYPSLSSIEADAGEDYGGIAWASWGFYHDPNSGVREQAQERLKHLRTLMEPDLYQKVADILGDTANKAALCQIARMKDDIGGYPLNLLLLGETDGHVSLDLNDPVQMAIFAPEPTVKAPATSSSHPPRPNVRDALEMFGLD